MEERPIPGFDKYTVTDTGKVYSYKWGRKREKALEMSHGHVTVQFQKNGYGYQRSVPLLVANAFLPKPKVSSMVRHKDGNVLNNDVSNLEWIINEDRIKGYC